MITPTGSKAIGALLAAALVIGGCFQPSAATTSEPTVPASPGTTAAASTAEPTPELTPERTPEPTPEPEPTEWPCPADSPVTVAEVLYADRSCFGRDEIRVRAWFDHGPVIGWLPPTIEPGWLVYPAVQDQRGFALWFKTPKNPDIACADGDACIATWVFLPPDSDVELRAPGRWVIAIGHMNDPAADRCHWDWPPDWEIDPSYDDADAVARCRRSFVLEALKDVD